MLRSFRFANHRSFRDKQELLLMPSYDDDREVVPVAVVFGANASGKSNLVDGLRLMWNLVRADGEGANRTPAFHGSPSYQYRPVIEWFQ